MTGIISRILGMFHKQSGLSENSSFSDVQELNLADLFLKDSGYAWEIISQNQSKLVKPNYGNNIPTVSKSFPNKEKIQFFFVQELNLADLFLQRFWVLLKYF
jgi:hypothetical protein